MVLIYWLWTYERSAAVYHTVEDAVDAGKIRSIGVSNYNSVRLTDVKSKESLAEYIARPPLSLKKIRYEPFKGKVLFHTKYSDYFRPTLALVEKCAPLRCARVFGRGSRDEAVDGFVRQFTE